jgi:hypothetical protein
MILPPQRHCYSLSSLGGRHRDSWWEMRPIRRRFEYWGHLLREVVMSEPLTPELEAKTHKNRRRTSRPDPRMLSWRRHVGPRPSHGPVPAPRGATRGRGRRSGCDPPRSPRSPRRRPGCARRSGAGVRRGCPWSWPRQRPRRTSPATARASSAPAPPVVSPRHLPRFTSLESLGISGLRSR